MAGMNAEAAPFVPKAPEEKPQNKPQQGPMDSAGVEVETGGMSGVSLWRPQYRGRVRSYSEQKGFGFISCDETMRQFGRDVFIHRYQMAEHALKVNQEVLFEVELNKMGHPQARRVRVNEEASGWDSYGYDGYGGNGAYYGGGGGGSRGADMYNMGGYNYHQDSLHQENIKLKQMLREAEQGRASAVGGMQQAPDAQGPNEAIEDMLRKCSGSSDMWEIIEQWGHKFGKVHVVTALYQLGLCRQYEKRTAEVTLTGALLDRLVLFHPYELTADEASKVLWALAVLDEVHQHDKAHLFAMKLGEEAAKRYSEFSPAEMVGLVQSLSRLVRSPEEDELVGRITTNFSDHALGGSGSLPRFAPHELAQWTNFLKEASGSSGAAQSGPPPPFNYGMPPMGGKGPPGPGSYPGSYSGGPPNPHWQSMGGKLGGPPAMGKGPPSGGPGYGGPPGSQNFQPGKGGQMPPEYGKGLPPGPKGFGDGLGGKLGMDGCGGKPGGYGLPPQGGNPGQMPGKGNPSMLGGSYPQGGGKGPTGPGGMPGGMQRMPGPTGKGGNPGRPMGGPGMGPPIQPGLVGKGIPNVAGNHPRPNGGMP